ncbi:MAG: hypothetical protein JWN32_3730, partial [Solirubrobacterales bacterium]|nr:hypothetical protein [Solirubrobacterales bacterium]
MREGPRTTRSGARRLVPPYVAIPVALLALGAPATLAAGTSARPPAGRGAPTPPRVVAS